MSTYTDHKKKLSNQDLNYRYSSAFKQKIVTEIESGVYTVGEVERIYGVTRATIYEWLRRFGKDYLINRTVRVQMRGEADRIKELEKEKQKLEAALAQAHLKILALESTIESAEEIYNVDLKKKFGTQVSGKVLKK
jgi:transposase-like protein